MVQTKLVQGAWNPLDRESIVINKITKSDDFKDTFFEIGVCSGLSTERTIPNLSEYQKPYAFYYAAPPLANIKNLFSNNVLKIREPNSDSSGNCIAQDKSDSNYFSIQLPTQANQISLTSSLGGMTIITALDLIQLQNYFKNTKNSDGTSFLDKAQPLNSFKGQPWADTLLSKIPEEQYSYIYLQQNPDKSYWINFIEVSLDLVIGFAPSGLIGFGYIDAINVCHLQLNTKASLLINGPKETIKNSPKTKKVEYKIPIKDLIGAGIIRQTY